MDILMVTHFLKQFSWSPVYRERDMLCFSKIRALDTQITELLSFVTKRIRSRQTSEVKGRNNKKKKKKKTTTKTFARSLQINYHKEGSSPVELMASLVECSNLLI